MAPPDLFRFDLRVLIADNTTNKCNTCAAVFVSDCFIVRGQRNLSMFQNDDQQMSLKVENFIYIGGARIRSIYALSLFASAALGIIHGASFAASHAFALNFFAWVGFAVLFTEQRHTVLPVLFVFFFGSFVSGLWWMGQALIGTTSLGPVLGVFSFIVCCVLLAAIPVASLWIAISQTRDRSIPRALALAASVALAEFARVRLLTGFPWLQVGHAYVDSPLAPLLPWIGAHGVSLIAIASAMLMAGKLTWIGSKRRAVLVVAIIVGATLSLLFTGQSAVSPRSEFAADESVHEALKVRLLQPALDTSRKFNRERLSEHVKQLLALAARPESIDLVVAPETAIPTTWAALPAEDRTLFENTVRQRGERWRVGAFDAGADGLPANAILALDATGAQTHYLKQHLVPFAEYVPRGFTWFSDLLQLPMSQRVSAPSLQHPGADGLVHTICMDLLYPLQTAAGAVIVNHSNYAWSSSDAPRWQFLAVARARALEYDKPVLIAANDGPTAAIDRKGVVMQRLPFRTRDALEVSIEPRRTVTPYAQAGDVPFLIVAILLLTAGVVASRRHVIRAPFKPDPSHNGMVLHEQER